MNYVYYMSMVILRAITYSVDAYLNIKKKVNMYYILIYLYLRNYILHSNKLLRLKYH